VSEKPPPAGTVAWIDLTVDDADAVRDFYRAVVGWKPEGLSMGDYQDYTMRNAETGAPTSGVCHRRGVNADLPSQWLIYVTVADLDRSINECGIHGGAVIFGPKDMGAHGRYCVVRDPAGAVMALMQPPAEGK
jgi:predicted enzyme related to lactoylglutathione lyase